MENNGPPLVMDFWSRALAKLEPQERNHILTVECTSPDLGREILREARAKRDAAKSKRWRFKKSNGTTIILRDVFEKILVCISEYTRVIDVATNADPVLAGLPWAMIRFFLQVSVSDLQAFGSLSEGIECTAGLLVRYHVLESLCASPAPGAFQQEREYLGNCIVQVYTAILRYLATSNRYWSQNTAMRMIKGIFKDMESAHCTLQSTVAKADEEAIRTAHILQHQELFNVSKENQENLAKLTDRIRAPIFRTARKVSQIQDQLNRDQRREIFQWLSTVHCEAHHHESCKKILKGTGRWLLECSEFLEWMNSSASAMFFLSGIPGSGKSKLTSIVIQSLLDQQTDWLVNLPPVAYFYCSQKSTDSRTADTTEIMSAILRQLAGRDVGLPLRGAIGQDFQQRKGLADQRGAQIIRLEIPEIVEHILSITEDDPIVVILDALDEVNEAERGDLFGALEQIVQDSQNVVKIFISSRNDGDIVERFEQCSKVSVNKERNKSDIQHFIDHKVNQAIGHKKILRGKVSPSLRDEIVRTLAQKAQEMFRWVELSIDMLSDSRRLSVEKDVRSELGQLPATLKQQYLAIYEEILQSAQSTANIARRVFSWMLAAQRALTIDELISAVALDDDGYYHSDLDASRILDICRNLIVVVSLDDQSSRQSFQVARLSVKEFLADMPELSSKRIHSLATLRCLRVFGSFAPSEDRLYPNARSERDSMRDYTIYLFEHAGRSELTEAHTTKGFMMRSFLFNETFQPTEMLHEWTKIVGEFFASSILPKDKRDMPLYKKMQFSDYYLGGVYLMCYYGLLGVLDTLENCSGVPWNGHWRNTALEAAVDNGQFHVAKWLLEHDIDGADNARSLDMSLRRAVFIEDPATVNLLLDHGADPLSGREYRLTPWSTACRGKDLGIFKRLLGSIELLNKTEPDKLLSLTFDWRNEALIDALLGNRSLAVIEMLIAHGAEASARICPAGNFGPKTFPSSTTLQIAVARCDAATIDLLLDAVRQSNQNVKESGIKGMTNNTKPFTSFVNALDDSGRTAIHYLLRRGCYLLRRGSALFSESESIMISLLENGADPNTVCHDGITALHVAAAINSIKIVQDLVKLGLCMESKSKEGATALHMAAGGTCPMPATIRYLIDAGMDPSNKDKEDRTALFYAAASCNVQGLEVLREAALIMNSATKTRPHNQIALPESLDRRSARINHSSRFRTFLDSRDIDGNNLLHVVATNRKIMLCNDQDEKLSGLNTEIDKTVQWLLDQGVDRNARNNRGRTPLSKLANLDWGPHSSLIAAKALLVRGTNLELPDDRGRTPLHYAAHAGHTQPLETLIKAGADIEAKDDELCTPLHLASRQGHEWIARFLLLQNADHTAKDIHGATPLHYAVKDRISSEITLMLIKAEADVNAADFSGSTPLHWAAKISNILATRVLLRYGAIPDTLDNDGQSVIAVAAGQASVIKGPRYDFEEDFLKLPTLHSLRKATTRKEPPKAALSLETLSIGHALY